MQNISLNISAERVAHVVRDAGLSLTEKRYHPAEVIVGLAELLGRIIAAQEGSPLLHRQLEALASDHIRRTLCAAYTAHGKNPEALG